MSISVIGVVGTLAATGYAAYASSQNSGAPAARDPAQEMGQLPTQQYYDMLGKYETDSAARQLTADQNRANWLLQMYPELTQTQHATDISDLQGYGREYAAVMNKIAPGWSIAKNALTGQIQQASAGPSDYLKQLEAEGATADQQSPLTALLTKQAANELALGGTLSPDETRQADQSVLGSYAQRGMALSNPAIFEQALNRTNLSEARQQQRQGFAENVAQLGDAEQQANRGFQLNVGNALEADQGQRANIIQSGLGAEQNTLAPVLGFYNNNVGQAAQVGTSANIIGAGASAATPLLNYGSDVFNTNFNAAAANQIAQQNNNAALAGAGINAAGSLAGNYLKYRSTTG